MSTTPPVRVGVGWSTEFDRSGWLRILYRRLRYAYRAPSFVASFLLAGGCSLQFVRFDEGLRLSELDGTTGRITDDVDLLYVATHGESPRTGYRVALRDADWAPCAGGFGVLGPSVAVFDTCDLIDLSDPEWQQPWISSVGPSLRLLLGFASPATVAQTSTRRGQGFAEKILAGAAIGPSWLEAVHSTGFAGTDVGVAIGFGDDQHDAEWALRRLTLSDLPRPRLQPIPVVAIEACH